MSTLRRGGYAVVSNQMVTAIITTNGGFGFFAPPAAH